MIKKTISLLIVILLICNIPIISLADDAKEFDSWLIDAFKESYLDSSDTFEDTGFNRALFSVLMLMNTEWEVDKVAKGNYSDGFDTLYMGRSGNKYDFPIYVVLIRGEENTLLLTYNPKAEYATYLVLDWASKAIMENAMESTTDRYWKVEADDISDALDLISELFNALSDN